VVSGSIPGPLRLVSGLAPGGFLVGSGWFPGRFRVRSGSAPGGFREGSGWFPGRFQILSSCFPGQLRVVSWSAQGRDHVGSRWALDRLRVDSGSSPGILGHPVYRLSGEFNNMYIINSGTFLKHFPCHSTWKRCKHSGHFSRFRIIIGNFCIVNQKCYVIMFS
jgi:hypothetical protein